MNLSITPLPLISAEESCKKNSMSEPSDLTILLIFSSFLIISNFCNTAITVATLLEPPPRPAPTGISLSIVIL